MVLLRNMSFLQSEEGRGGRCTTCLPHSFERKWVRAGFNWNCQDDAGKVRSALLPRELRSEATFYRRPLKLGKSIRLQMFTRAAYSHQFSN
jgi:hypothetical protein